ncbi:MAG TPA: hypothetical protein VK173_05020 [Lacibacter sp.]|nr:hypothetical protein [Lacibacter sp.]
MKQLSYWAKVNPQRARFLIVLIYILINIIGLIAGSLLWASGIQLEESFMFVLAVTVVSLYIIYPKKAAYYKRKIFHGLMAVCTFLIITVFGNQLHNPNPQLFFVNTTQAVTHITNSEQLDIHEPTNIKKEKRLQKKEAGSLWKKLAAKNDRSKAAKILLIVLTVIVALGLLYVLAALSCTIACSGAEALAVLVALVGTFGIVFGAIRIIQHILGKERKKKRAKSSTD